VSSSVHKLLSIYFDNSEHDAAELNKLALAR